MRQFLEKWPSFNYPVPRYNTRGLLAYERGFDAVSLVLGQIDDAEQQAYQKNLIYRDKALVNMFTQGVDLLSRKASIARLVLEAGFNDKRVAMKMDRIFSPLEAQLTTGLNRCLKLNG